MLIVKNQHDNEKGEMLSIPVNNNNCLFVQKKGIIP